MAVKPERRLNSFPSLELRNSRVTYNEGLPSAFLSLAVISATSSPEHNLWGASAVSGPHTRSNQPGTRPSGFAAGVPILRRGDHRDDSQVAEHRQLLALFKLRRDLDACSTTGQDVRAVAPVTAPMISVATDRVRIVRELRELIVALDRRVPQVHRMGELAIAHAAATLRSEALRRIEELRLDGTADD